METNKTNTAGLDISLSENCAQTAFNHAKDSFKFRQGKWGQIAPLIDNHYCQLIQTGDGLLAISSDGVGTKAEIAERCKRYDTLGHDLVAMIIDDLICVGAEPSHMTNILDVDHLDPDIINKLMSGLKAACQEAGIAITGGETAELGSRISGYGDGMHFNWCASGFGLIPKGRKPIDGSDINPGDLVLSLQSRGMRSNGYSLARRVLHEAFGDNWHEIAFDETRNWGEVLLTPSRIFAPKILKILEQISLKGIVHVTGGGVASNLKRILKPWGLGATLDNLHTPHPEMLELQKLGNISDSQAYELWNMGNGMLLVIDPINESQVLDLCQRLELNAKVCGSIHHEPHIQIRSLST